MHTTTIAFSEKMWKYSTGKASWFFITLPQDDADFIHWLGDKTTVGFGFVRVEVTIGTSSWKTSLFPTKEKAYILCIKADIRKKEGLLEGDVVRWIIRIC